MSRLGRGFRFETRGVEQTLRTFEEFAGRVDEFADQLMEDYAKRIYDRSQALVPVRNPAVTPPRDIAGGSLKQSGAFFKIADGEWAVGYGGESYPRDAFYAVYVHEMPYYHEPPTQWKYLQTAVDELTPELSRVAGATWESVFSATGRGGERYVPIRGDISPPGYGPEEARLRPTPSTLLE